MFNNFISAFLGSASGAILGGFLILHLIEKEMDRRYVKKDDKEM